MSEKSTITVALTKDELFAIVMAGMSSQRAPGDEHLPIYTAGSKCAKAIDRLSAAKTKR